MVRLIAVSGSRFVEQQRRKHDVQNWFLCWEHAGETVVIQ